MQRIAVLRRLCLLYIFLSPPCTQAGVYPRFLCSVQRPGLSPLAATCCLCLLSGRFPLLPSLSPNRWWTWQYSALQWLQMHLLVLVNKGKRRSRRKQGAQRVGCVNHAMVEQLTCSTMEKQSQAPSSLCFRLDWNPGSWMAHIPFLQTWSELYGVGKDFSCVEKYCGYSAVEMTRSCRRHAILQKLQALCSTWNKTW